MTQRTLSTDQAMARARRLSNAGDNAAAAEIYQQILAHYPGNKKARKALKSIQGKGGSHDRRARLMDDMNKLMQLYSSGNYDRAYSHASHLVKTYPEQPAPPNIMGVIQAGRGDMEAAIKCYQLALKADPENIDAINNMGSAFRELKDYDRAISCFRQLIKLTPDDSDLHYNLGNTLLDCGHSADAIDAYQRAIELRPLHSNYHKQLGAALASKNQHEKAIASYENALNIDPKMVEAHVLLGVSLHRLGTLDKAIKSLRRAVELQPESPQALVELAHALLKSNQNEEAAAAYTACLELQPDSLDAQHFLQVAKDLSPAKPSQHYVQELFDKYASRFDTHLQENLGYEIPHKLRKLSDECGLLKNKIPKAIDLGCGTGLSGMAFHDVCDSVIGVDLSGNMLAEARKKNCYEALHEGDIEQILKQLKKKFDLFICADTLVYLGDLKSLFTAIETYSSPGALLLISTELGSDSDFQLLQSGRYRHSHSYVKRIADDAGFSLVSMKDEQVRKEHGEWIKGALYIFRQGGNASA